MEKNKKIQFLNHKKIHPDNKRFILLYIKNLRNHKRIKKNILYKMNRNHIKIKIKLSNKI